VWIPSNRARGVASLYFGGYKINCNGKERNSTFISGTVIMISSKKYHAWDDTVETHRKSNCKKNRYMKHVYSITCSIMRNEMMRLLYQTFLLTQRMLKDIKLH